MHEGSRGVKLKLGDGLALPLDVVTEKLAFLGRTGTGKTYAAMKLAELMLEAGAQVLALDAVGKWYGLRVDGAGPGFPIPVFGGLNGDFPLEATGGKLMAEVVTERGISAVLDVSQFTHGEQTRFALDFATQFFQRKKASPSAVHLVLEECQEFVPQNAMPGEQAMLSAFERLWKLGRNFGVGGSLISQRPQEINKKALNQTGTLFVFGMTGPQERKAIESWVSAQGINEDIGEVLPTLQQGQPHVWSPTFLGVSKTVRIAEKRTADVSATPKFGARAKERPLTPIDGEQLRTQMAATIERAKADDRKELRQRIVALERELRQTKTAVPAPAAAADTAKTDALIQDQLRDIVRLQGLAATHIDKQLELLQRHAREEAERWERLARKAEEWIATFRATTRAAAQPVREPRSVPTRAPEAARRAPHVAPRTRGQESGTDAAVSPAQQKILNGLAFLDGIGVSPADKTQLALLVGVSPTSGGYFNNLGSLRSAGLIDYPAGGMTAVEQQTAHVRRLTDDVEAA
jgi:hypothetical protein